MGYGDYMFGPKSMDPTFTTKIVEAMAHIFQVGAMPDAVAFKQMEHFAQNGIVYRFQEFSDCFGRMWCDWTDLVPLENITGIPFDFVVGEND